jgi:WD40 repeat protein
MRWVVSIAKIAGTRRQHARALLQSLITVAVLAIVAAAVYWRQSMHRVSVGQQRRVIDCQPCHRESLLIMLTKTNDVYAGTLWTTLVGLEIHQDGPVRVPITDAGSPGCFVASQRERGIFVADTQDGSIRWIGGQVDFSDAALLGRHARGVAHALVLAPDERMLVSLGHGELYGWDLESGRLRWVRFDHEPSAAVILPDSRSMILCRTTRSGRAELEEIDLEVGATIQEIICDVDRIKHLIASPNGHYVAGLESGKGVRLLERQPDGIAWQDQKTLRHLELSDSVIPAFSPESDQLILGARHGRKLLVWDLEHGDLASKVDIPGGFTVGGSMFLQSDTLLVWSKEGEVHHWRWHDGATTTQPVLVSTWGHE